MNSTQPIDNTGQTRSSDVCSSRFWQGKIQFSNDHLEIENCITGHRTTLGHLSAKVVNVCSSSRFVFALLNDGAVVGLREDKDGSFRLYETWILNGQCDGYCREEHLEKNPTTVDLPLIDINVSSHFGLSIIQNEADIDNETLEPSNSFISCTDTRLYIAFESGHHGISCKPNKLCEITIETRKSNLVSDFLPDGVWIVQVKCGYGHVVVLDSTGCVHTFGCGTRGELGHGDLESITKPKIVEALLGVRVRRIGVGGWHNVAVTEFGDAYVWGWNEHCQLGYHSDSMQTITEPFHLEMAGDIPITVVTCGSRHILFLLENGEVYGCGWNAYGQLGDTMGEEFCTLRKIKFVEDQKKRVISISAVGWSTVIFVGL